MKLLKVTTVIVLNAILVTPAFSEVYIPDIFGAAMQGQRQAQYDNQRYSSYYSSLPVYRIDVFNSSGKVKMFRRASINKQDQMCWQVTNLPRRQRFFTVKEYLTRPENGSLSANSAHEPYKFREPSSSKSVIYYKIDSRNSGYISNCWVFGEGTTTGQYSITVNVDNTNFDYINFKVVR